jgi:hypothetical protein
MRRRLPGRDLWGWTALTGLLMVTVALEGITEGSARAGPANAALDAANNDPWLALDLAIRFADQNRPFG